MSIIVEGMKMPRHCGECGIDWCNIWRRAETPIEKRPSDCPLIEVPTPHGRLIEESKVLDIVSEWCPDDDGSVGKDGDLREMLDEIEAIPTIIPACEEEAWAK